MIELIGRTLTKNVESETGLTILDLALKHEVDWGFSCTRGTCARCRCQISEGMQLLNRVTDAEYDRLEEDELKQGFRLGCQAVVKQLGELKAANKPYY